MAKPWYIKSHLLVEFIFFAIGLLLLLKIYSNLKSFKRENHILLKNWNRFKQVLGFNFKNKTDSSDYNQMQSRRTRYIDWLQNYEHVYALNDTSSAKMETAFLKTVYKLK